MVEVLEGFASDELVGWLVTFFGGMAGAFPFPLTEGAGDGARDKTCSGMFLSSRYVCFHSLINLSLSGVHLMKYWSCSL